MTRLYAVIGTNVQTPMEGWVSRLAYVLRNVESRGAGALDRAANAAGLDLEWDPSLSKSERLARRLIHAGPTAISQAVEQLAEVVPETEDSLRDLVSVLQFAWVDPETVADIPRVANRATPPRLIMINAETDWVGLSYIKRASCGSHRWLVLEANNLGSELAQVDAEQLFMELIASARGPIELGPDALPAAVVQRLEQWGARYRFVAIIPSRVGLTPEQLVDLQERLKPLTFVVLTGLERSPLIGDSTNALVLQPQLEDGDEREAHEWIDDLRFLTRSET